MMTGSPIWKLRMSLSLYNLLCRIRVSHLCGSHLSLIKSKDRTKKNLTPLIRSFKTIKRIVLKEKSRKTLSLQLEGCLKIKMILILHKIT